MAFALALPKFKELRDGDVAATFIVPAPQGCNLNCPFCVIRLRKETTEQNLLAQDYVEFLDGLNQRESVGLVSLQGYEPLLPESWEYSEAILKRGNDLGIDTAMVTNGTHLAERVDDLVRLDITGITVSLDSADPTLHDLTRRTPGAFEATLQGLKAVSASPIRERVMVASVLQRKKADYLLRMPQLLASLGIKQWVVTPVFRIGRGEFGGPAGEYEDIAFQFRRLSRLANEFGIDLIVDDEFGDLVDVLDDVASREAMRVRRLKRLYQVVRLSPNGTCSIGKDILRQVTTDLPTWNPANEMAGDFIQKKLKPRLGGSDSLVVGL